MSSKVHTSAGYGGFLDKPTAKFKVDGTDLGFLFVGGKGNWVGGMFGDTFNKNDPHAPSNHDLWRSPVMGRTSNRDFLTAGIRWDNFAGSANTGGTAKEVFPYNHVGDRGQFNSGNFDSFTVIPNDAIQVPDGRYFGMGFRVRNWAADAGQAMCHTISNAWFWSDEPNADTWQVGRFREDLSRLYEWGVNEGRNSFFQNASFLMLPNDNMLYVFGSREGRKIGFGAEADGVYLRRVRYDLAFKNEDWEYWGYTGSQWEWGKNVQPTPILRPITPGGFIGELNAQYVAGKVVLTYSDTLLGAVALVSDRPDGIWSAPTVLVSRLRSLAQYAPSVHPWNTNLNDAYFHLSSWQSIPNIVKLWDPSQPAMISLNYCTQGWRGSLVSEPVAQAVAETAKFRGLDVQDASVEERDAVVRKIMASSAEVNSAV